MISVLSDALTDKLIADRVNYRSGRRTADFLREKLVDLLANKPK